MKKRIRQLFCIMAGAGALAGCVEDPAESGGPNGGANTLTATIAAESPTRSVLMDNQTAKKIEITWTAGDQIGAFGSQSGTNVLYAAAGNISEDGKTAQFTTTGTAPTGDELFAYHPYKDGTTMAGEMLNLTMPASQTYKLVDGVPQPDAAANIMVGKGASASSIVFRNLFAILRIGFAPETADDAVKRVEFTDLSGKPVSGGFTVSWNGDVPEAAFPQSGADATKKITLDCGEGAATGSASQRFFMIVPAREYTKGFKVTFVLASGAKVEKTVGATAGKTLKRNGVYNIGHLPAEYEGITYKLAENSSFLSSEDDRMDEVVSMQLGDGLTGGTALILMVNKAFDPQYGERIVINETSELLPEGFAGRVQTLRDAGGGLLEVFLVPEENLANLFEDLSIGEASLYNADGSVNPAGGIEIDLASYVTRIEMADGVEVPFTRSGSTIGFADAPLTLQGVEAQPPGPLTRGWGDAQGAGTGAISLPNIAYTFDTRPDDLGTFRVTVGCQMDVKLFFAAKVETFIPTYIDARADVNFNCNMQFTAAAEVILLQEAKHLLTLYCASIPAGPVLITPKIEFYLVAGASGALEISSKIEYTKSASFGFTYGQKTDIKGYNNTPKEEPQATSPWKDPSGELKFSGSVSFGGMAKIGIGMWKAVQVLLTTDNRVKTEARWKINWNAESVPGLPFVDPPGWLIDDTGLNVDYENQVGIELRAFGWKKEYQLDPFSFPIYQNYFVPKLSNLAVSYQPDGTLNLSVKAERKTIWGVTIGADICEKIGFNSWSPVLQSVVIGNYTGGDEAVTLENVAVTSLDPGKTYSVRITVELLGRIIRTGQIVEFSTDPLHIVQFRKILRQIYESAGGTEWSDNLFTHRAGSITSKVPWMSVWASMSPNEFTVGIGKDAPGTSIAVTNLPFTDRTWTIRGGEGCKIESISIDNDCLTTINGNFPNLRTAIVKSEKLESVSLYPSEKLTLGSSVLKNLRLDLGTYASETAWALDVSGCSALETVTTQGVLTPGSWTTFGPSVEEVTVKGPADGTTRSTPQKIDLSNASVRRLAIENQSHLEVTGNPDVAEAAFMLTFAETNTPLDLSIKNWEGTISVGSENILSNPCLTANNLSVIHSLTRGGELVFKQFKFIDRLTLTDCGMTRLDLTGLYFGGAVVRQFDVTGCNNLITVNLMMPNSYTDASGQTVANTTSQVLPQFLWDMAARGVKLAEPAVKIDWRYSYSRINNVTWRRGDSRKYGFYLYDSEPGSNSVERSPVIDGYQSVGRTDGVQY